MERKLADFGLRHSLRAAVGALLTVFLGAGCQSGTQQDRMHVQAVPSLPTVTPATAPSEKLIAMKYGLRAKGLAAVELPADDLAVKTEEPARPANVYALAADDPEGKQETLLVSKEQLEEVPAPAPDRSSEVPERLPLPEMLSPPDFPSPLEPPADALNLTLASALAQALAENPDLVTLRGQLKVNESMVDVADTPLWNPFVQAQYLPNGSPLVRGNPGEPASGAGQSNYYIWGMQRFEIAHQRRYRTQSAMAALNQVHWNILQAELLNVAQTSRLYFTALYQKQLYALAVSNRDLKKHLLEVQRRRLQANLATASAVTTAEIAARQSQRQAEVAKIAYDAALVPLRQHLNIPVSTPLVLTDRLEDIRWLPLRPGTHAADETSFAAELVEGRPDVMAAQVGIRVAQANRSLARAAMIPDIQSGPIYETADDGTRYLGLRLQMDVPVFNTGAPLAHQRQMEFNQQALTYRQLKVKAGLEAQTTIDQFERVREIAAKLEPVRTGADTREAEEIMRLFEAGQADILAVLATQDALLQESRMSLDVLNQLAQSAANVIQATGLPLEHVAEFPSLSSIPPAPGDSAIIEEDPRDD